MISVGPTGRVIVGRGKSYNVAIFSDTINAVNVELCTMVLLVKLYLFILLSVTLTIFQGHRSVKQFKLKIVCSYPIKLKLDRIVKNVR